MSRERYKPLSFSTTMRNPYRIAGFLKCLQSVENKVLTNDVIMYVAKEVIKSKLYQTRYENSVPEYKEIYENEEETFSNAQLDDIIQNTTQKHKEAGFDKGWPSRFDTWYKLAMEFGYVYYAMNEPIVISDLGHMLINAISGEVVNEEMIQNVFLHSMVKYQTDNPFRKNLNSNVPLILLLKVIKLLRENDDSTAGVFRQELSFFICWPDNNADELYNFIMQFRQKFRFGEYTDELIYDECLKILHANEDDKNYFKMDKITGEAVDEYIRKMRITGVISLRGNGRFIDFNTLLLNRINYVLENYSEYPRFKDKIEYFQYMGAIDNTILTIQSDVEYSFEDNIRQLALIKYSKEYDRATVFNELQKVCNRHESRDPMLRVISGPARLEFLVSIALIQNFEGLGVYPNYVVDDEGLPTCTASGGMPDIVCKNGDNVNSIVEVTLMMGRQQLNNEMIPICRHLSEVKVNFPNAFAIFVAPSVHEDARRYGEYISDKENLQIKTYGINGFIDEISNYSTIEELAS